MNFHAKCINITPQEYEDNKFCQKRLMGKNILLLKFLICMILSLFVCTHFNNNMEVKNKIKVVEIPPKKLLGEYANVVTLSVSSSTRLKINPLYYTTKTKTG